MTILETPRLSLREWRDDDIPAFAAMNADPRVMRYFPAPLTAQESEAFLERIRAEFDAEPFGAYAVERKADGQLLGLAGLHRITMNGALNGCVEIAWRFRADAWGNGYATEAARACLEYAAKIGLDNVYAFTTVTNTPSERIMQRLGMERLGEFDHPSLPAGHPLLRHVLYGTADQ